MNTSQRKPMASRRVEMSIDVEELQMFDGIAQCANHTIEFKIGKFSILSKLKLLNSYHLIHRFQKRVSLLQNTRTEISYKLFACS